MSRFYLRVEEAAAASISSKLCLIHLQIHIQSYLSLRESWSWRSGSVCCSIQRLFVSPLTSRAGLEECILFLCLLFPMIFGWGLDVSVLFLAGRAQRRCWTPTVVFSQTRAGILPSLCSISSHAASSHLCAKSRCIPKWILWLLASARDGNICNSSLFLVVFNEVNVWINEILIHDVHLSSWLQFCTLYFLKMINALFLFSFFRMLSLPKKNPLNTKVALEKGYLFKKLGPAAVSDWVLDTLIICTYYNVALWR